MFLTFSPAGECRTRESLPARNPHQRIARRAESKGIAGGSAGFSKTATACSQFERSRITQNSHHGIPSLHKADSGEGPITENCLAVNQLLCNKSPATTIVAGIPVISQNKVLAVWNNRFLERPVILKLRFQIRL